MIERIIAPVVVIMFGVSVLVVHFLAKMGH